MASPCARSFQETEVLPAAWEIKPIQAQTEIRLKERITDAIKKTLQQQNRRQQKDRLELYFETGLQDKLLCILK